MNVNIYSRDTDGYNFEGPYYAKELLNKSIRNTQKGFEQIKHGTIVNGCGNILLGRVQTISAFAVALLASIPKLAESVVGTPCFVIPATILNICSRLPRISSIQKVQNFTKRSSDLIYQAMRINLVAYPVVFLFLSASTINLIPGILNDENIFFTSIHRLVERFGPIKTIEAQVINGPKFKGKKDDKDSLIEDSEEFLRALSYKNTIRTEYFHSVTHHYTYQIRR